MSERQKIQIVVERKPDPPGFTCSFCEEQREYWQAAYRGPGIIVCSHCRLTSARGHGYWNHGLTWGDQNAIYIAQSFLLMLTAEIKDGKRYTAAR